MRITAKDLSLPNRLTAEYIEHPLGEYILDPFHIRMNDDYVATVHKLESLIDYIELNPKDAKSKGFGEVVKGSGSATDEQCNLMTMIITKAKGMAVYNRARHTCVEFGDKIETVSIRTRDGKLITVASVHGLVEVVYHNSGGTVINGNEDIIPSFDVIGPMLGADAIPRTTVTNLWIVDTN